jgi:HD-like signal output (HDOD) protein
MQFDRNKLAELINTIGLDSDGVPATNMMEFEVQAFGATHEDFGACLCEKWKFPKSFAFVCGFHHNPMAASEDQRTLPAIIYVADRIAAETKQGFRGDMLTTDINPAVLDFLKLSTEKLAEIRNNVLANAKDYANTLQQ